MSRYSAIKKAFAQIALEDEATAEILAVRQSLLARQNIRLAGDEEQSKLPDFLKKLVPEQTPQAQATPNESKLPEFLRKPVPQTPTQPTQPKAQPAQKKPAQQPQATAKPEKAQLPDFLKKLVPPEPDKVVIPNAETPKPQPPKTEAPKTEAPKPAAQAETPNAKKHPLLSEEDIKRWQAVREQMQQKADAKNNSELREYINQNPPPASLLDAEARGTAIITMPKPGTPLDALPAVPDGAHDEVGDMVIEDVGAVSYPDGQPVFAAFGDKSEYEGMLKAAGFKPVVVYYFPKPEGKRGWHQAKRANMYACKGIAAKNAFEAAWLNPNHPVAREGKIIQAEIDSRRAEMEAERVKHQSNIDRIQRGASAYTTEGYDEDRHRKSYAAKPHKLVAIPTPKRLGLKALQYLPYQLAAVSFINERLGGKDDAKPDAERGAILADSPGIGKAQPLHAGILTPNGWTTIGNLKPGDEILAGNGEITTVTGVFPQGIKDVYQVEFSDGSRTQCCDEHLWVVNTRYRRKQELPHQVIELKELMRNGLMEADNAHCKYYIPIAKDVDLKHQEVDIHPYVLGCILGNGSITQRQVLFSSKDNEIIERLRSLLPDNMLINSTDDRGCNYRLSSGANGKPSALIQSLKRLNLMSKNSFEKFIPNEYLFNSRLNRLEVLRGLMDTDGTQTAQGHTQFSSGSLALVKNVEFLVNSLGGVGRLTKKISASGKMHYTLTMCMPDDVCPFWVQRKAEKWKPREKYKPSRAMKSTTFIGKEECVCISVAHESKTYITDDCIVTHNTMPAIGVINTNPSIKKVLVVCPSVMVPVWIREMKKWLAGDHVRNPQTDKLTVQIGRYKKGEPLPDITVMSYESLSRGYKDISNPEAIGDRAWDYVVLDESHRVKDEHSVQACVIMGGRPKRRKSENPLVPEIKTPGLDGDTEYPGVPSKRRLLLTGTPIPSYSWELYANLHFVRPDVFNNEDEFMYQFAVMKAFRATMWKKNKSTGSPELHRIFITKPIRPHNMTLLNKMLFGGGTYNSRYGKKHFDGIIMRRIHKDLEELGDQYTWPPKGTPQYRAVKEGNTEGLDARATELDSITQQIQRAKQQGAKDDTIAELEHEYNEKVKVSFQRVAKVRNAIGMRKAPYVAAEAAIQARGSADGRPNQVLVFAYHKNVIETIAQGIEQQFKAMGHPEWKVAIVYGATSDKKREETFEQFQTDPNVKVIVASYKVLKEGITLTAANKVIHGELMPNPIDYEQAYARAWRRGQDRSVDETYIWLPRTFDERLYNIASGKYAAANRILNHRLPEPQTTTEQ